MSYWSSIAVALGLVSVAVSHWLFTSRMMAVSGAFTALVNRLRQGPTPQETWSEAALLDAIRAATAEMEPELEPQLDPEAVSEVQLRLEPEAREALASGSTALGSTAHGSTVPAAGTAFAELPAAPRSTGHHLAFLIALIFGGTLSAFLRGPIALSFDLGSGAFCSLTAGNGVLGFGALLLGGVLVGAGTRMAGGCTSGHGLCGVSRFQSGSLISTMAFFGGGILMAQLLARLA